MTRERVGDALALLNALLNATSATLIVAGRVAIVRKRVATHRAMMISAFLTSAVFLVSYLARVALTGTHADPHRGWVHLLYLAILGTHMVLAIAVVPLVMRALWLGHRMRVDQHRAVVRFAFPLWLYVSVTGVIVYAMLYHVPA